MKDPETFIDTVTNIVEVVSDIEGNHEARDDPKVGLESVQKTDHEVAENVGSDNKPPTSANHLPPVSWRLHSSFCTRRSL